MLTIPHHIIDEIIAHARQELPNEACGYLAGNGNEVKQAYALTNIDHSPEHFSFDPAEQFRTVKAARKAGLEILANFHSHPETPARPSVEDIELAYDPEISYVIISFAGETPDVKSFKIRNGEVDKEEIRVVVSV
ncbi:MAG: M67 family metallopeptidase [Bacteroidota bacterium]|nr:M67 family metallopeptidase [Bacteroidota bacterium]